MILLIGILIALISGIMEIILFKEFIKLLIKILRANRSPIVKLLKLNIGAIINNSNIKKEEEIKELRFESRRFDFIRLREDFVHL
ncbi:MAG: hypothetical protein ABIN23_08375 [candidate division WOR-3 bacterium]